MFEKIQDLKTKATRSFVQKYSNNWNLKDMIVIET